MQGEKDTQPTQSQPVIERNSEIQDYGFSGSYTQLLLVGMS